MRLHTPTVCVYKSCESIFMDETCHVFIMRKCVVGQWCDPELFCWTVAGIYAFTFRRLRNSESAQGSRIQIKGVKHTAREEVNEKMLVLFSGILSKVQIFITNSHRKCRTCLTSHIQPPDGNVVFSLKPKTSIYHRH